MLILEELGNCFFLLKCQALLLLACERAEKLLGQAFLFDSLGLADGYLALCEQEVNRFSILVLKSELQARLLRL